MSERRQVSEEVLGVVAVLRPPKHQSLPGWEVYVDEWYIGHVEGTHGKWEATSWRGDRLGGFLATRSEALRMLVRAGVA